MHNTENEVLQMIPVFDDDLELIDLHNYQTHAAV